MSALYLEDDADLVENLRRVSAYLENEAAHRPNRDEFRQIGQLAHVCRSAAVRLEQLVAPRVEPSGPPRLRLADEDDTP